MPTLSARKFKYCFLFTFMGQHDFEVNVKVVYRIRHRYTKCIYDKIKFNEKTFTDVWQGKYMPRTNTLTYDILFEIFKMWMHWALNRLYF